MNWINEKIFVTGASGFIGGRVCERLIQEGARQVTALVHNPSHGVRIARLPVKICTGDLLDREALPGFLGDASIVIHLGLGHGTAIVNGTKNILEASLKSGVKRFIHMSTAAVYGYKPSPQCETEDAPLRRTGDVYCDNKLRAEEIALKFHRKGLPIVILRPSIVCGPYSRWHTRFLASLSRGEGMLIDGGSGICNTTYVDNLVDAIFLSVEKQEALGESFFITDGERLTWRDFVGAHAAMMKARPALSDISTAEIIEHYKKLPGMWRSSWTATRRLLLSREFRDMAKQIPIFENLIQRLWFYYQGLDEQRRQRFRRRFESDKSPEESTLNHKQTIPGRDTLAIQTGTVFFSIDKARSLLGYQPRVSFFEGMRLTETWLRFANYL